MKPVKDLVQIIKSPDTRNRGAILAGLTSTGDRRIHAVARTLRKHMTARDVRDYSRVHDVRMIAPRFHFCVEWLADLSDVASRDKREILTNLATMLRLIVVYDETGYVDDFRVVSSEGFVETEACRIEPYEGFLDTIAPTISALARRPELSPFLTPLHHFLHAHQSRAATLRERKAA
jgi:hypothetical protein